MDVALSHAPGPLAARVWARADGMRALDRIGRFVWPAFAGVIVVSAVKRTVQGITIRARPRLSPALRPAIGPPAGAVGRDADPEDLQHWIVQLQRGRGVNGELVRVHATHVGKIPV